MQVNKHYDYDNEEKYLGKTVEVLDGEIGYLSKEVNESEEELISMKKRAGGNYSDELVVKLTIHDAYKRKLKMLERATNKPYFGRIDFKELMKDEFETFYIGKTSITNRNDDKRYVIDWRTPMASLYYSGEIGDVMYNAPKGVIMGDLRLKRQYEIVDRNLVNIFDKGLTPMDEYLQEALWQKKDNRLRDIVTTIQKEQNSIIRAGENKIIIVQGVAGSGKTTIVLHRIAYLMYTYQEMFDPEKLLIVVPNRLFLNYISDVLPDLGVEEINQTTFEDLTMTLLDKELSITGNEEKFYKLINNNSSTEEYRDKLKQASWFKGSLLLKDILDEYIKDLSKELCPSRGLKVCEYTIYPEKEMADMFNLQYNYLPLIPRLERIKKYVKDNIKDRVKAKQNEIFLEYEKKARIVKDNISDEEEVRQKLIEVYDERDRIKERLDKSIVMAINNYFEEFPSIDATKAYTDFISNKSLLREYCKDKIEEKYVDFISDYSKELFLKNEFEGEDLAPFLYVHMKLKGSDLKGRFNHIVVDEAQDYSQFQMYILKELSSNSSFTIVGDLSQGIHSYKGIQTWDSFMKDVFQNRDMEFLTLRKCYRATMEIMEFANAVIKKWKKDDITLAEPVLRSGDKPRIIKKEEDSQIINDIIDRLDSFKDEGHKSVAIICKDNKESEEVYNLIKKNTNEEIHLITDKDTAYTGGIVVIPAYMSKGLEFDVVIVYDCSKDKYFQDELNVKLLYVSITRPLHKLFIYYKGEASPLIDVDKELISEEK